MVIIIIKAYQQSTIILIGQNTILMLLVTTINMLVIFKRSVGPRNKISRIEENPEIILIIFMAMEEIFPTLSTQCSQNFHSLHKI